MCLVHNNIALLKSKEVHQTGREWLAEAVDEARHLDNTGRSPLYLHQWRTNQFAPDCSHHHWSWERRMVSHNTTSLPDKWLHNAVLTLRYFVIGIWRLITRLWNNIFSWNLVVLSDSFKNKCMYFYQDTFRFAISIAHRLRIGHTRCTHTYLLTGEDQPECTTCQCPLTVKHILVDCFNFNDTRNKHFIASSMEKLFRTAEIHNVLDFIKETHFYSKLWCLQTFLY